MGRNTKQEKLNWQGKGFSFFQNTACEYFPCHAGVDAADFNCLFCFCPLHHREDCGGAFYLLADGTKDCSACTFPHARDSYGEVLAKLNRFMVS
jgi:Zn-finger protein